MKLKWRSVRILGTLLCLVYSHGGAQAQEQSPTGPYVALGVGLTVDRFDDLPDGVEFDSGVGFALDIGYRFHPNIALEGSCDYYLGIHSDDTIPPSNGDILSFSTSLKGYLSTRRLQPYVQFGLGVSRVRFDDGPDPFKNVGFTVQAGGGVDFYIVPGVSLGINAAWVEATGKIEDNDYVSIGLGAQYRF